MVCYLKLWTVVHHIKQYTMVKAYIRICYTLVSLYITLTGLRQILLGGLMTVCYGWLFLNCDTPSAACIHTGTTAYKNSMNQNGAQIKMRKLHLSLDGCHKLKRVFYYCLNILIFLLNLEFLLSHILNLFVYCVAPLHSTRSTFFVN